MSPSSWSVARGVLMVLTGATILFFVYYKPSPSSSCHPPPTPPGQIKNHHGTVKTLDNPILLVWFWPENYMFDFEVCKKLFAIDGCQLTNNKTLYSKADAVLISHKAIQENLSNMPTLPRPEFQRWIWFNMEPPPNTHRFTGLENLFNLTLSFRHDADICVRWRLTAKKGPIEPFVLPRKDRLVCWIVGSNTLQNGTGYNYYRELVKYIKIDLYNSTFNGLLERQGFFSTVSSCKFYLAFENFIYKDYITDHLNGPLAAGTVPVVLGPTRRNYEDFIPGDSFIHVNDFPNAKLLADHLLKLDKDEDAYMGHFEWRKLYFAERHLTEQTQKFIQPICLACDHVARHKEYRVVPNLYKWFFD